MDYLKFTRDKNAKLKAIKSWSPIKNPKVYSLSLLSGVSCPGAEDCYAYARVDKKTGKRTIQEGKKTKFRCFSASQEAAFNDTYNQRKYNFDLLKKKSLEELTEIIFNSIPRNADYIRVHVGGDFFSKDYMEAFYDVARYFKNIQFWAYTKSIKWMHELEGIRPPNFSMNASRGSKHDALIDELNLKSAEVIFHPKEAKGLPIDKTEEHAIMGRGSFALLLHGTQGKNTEAGEAIKTMNKEGIEYSYKRN
tara:strand:- start:2793 stop:3542 length:750 start_codon:yes stop_codon:yes gene_type:complete